MLMLYGIHPSHLNKPKPLNRFSDVHAGSSLVIIFCHITKRLVIARLSHWPLGGKTIAWSLPKGLLILKGQRIFFHLLGWRVIPAIFAMLTRSPSCVLGLRVLKIALSLTSLGCWINNFGSLTLTSLHAYLSVYMFSNFMWFYLFFLCRGGGGGLELEWNGRVYVCECEWCQWMGICRWMHVYEFVRICIFGIWRGLSCWINNFGSLTLTSLHAYLSVYMFSNFMWFYLFFCVGGGEGVWNLNGMEGFMCVNVNDVSGWVFAGECMCMSLFEFAYLGFEEEWDYLFIFWGFSFSMSWLFLLVQYFDVFNWCAYFWCLVYIMYNVIFNDISAILHILIF